MSANPFADVFLEILAGITPPLRVADGKVDPGTALPYAVLYIDLGTPGAPQSLTFSTDRLDVTAQLTFVGEDRNQVDTMRADARAALIDVVPTVPGRACLPIRLFDSQPTRRDDDVQPPVMYAVDLYRLPSDPA